MVKQCQMHGITSLPEAIDKTVSRFIRDMNSRGPVSHITPPYEFQYLMLDDVPFEVVRQTEMIMSERVLADFLVECIKTNERVLELRVEKDMNPRVRAFHSAVGRIFGFVNDMHNAGRDRFCFLFVRLLIIDKADAFSKEFSKILVKAL